MGGKDSGANPLCHLLSALVGCSEVTLHTVAKQLGLQVGKVKWTAWGKLDARGLRGVQGVPARFQEIDILAEIDTTANSQQLTQLRDAVEQRCPVANTLAAVQGLKFQAQYKSSRPPFVSSMGIHL
eukprot:jgi/Astpho2/9231/Aster-x0389